jgi:hypothetical protein
VVFDEVAAHRLTSCPSGLREKTSHGETQLDGEGSGFDACAGLRVLVQPAENHLHLLLDLGELLFGLFIVDGGSQRDACAGRKGQWVFYQSHLSLPSSLAICVDLTILADALVCFFFSCER